MVYLYIRQETKKTAGIWKAQAYSCTLANCIGFQCTGTFCSLFPNLAVGLKLPESTLAGKNQLAIIANAQKAKKYQSKCSPV